MSWVVALAILGSALLHAGWNALVKGKSGDPLAASAGLAIVWALGGLPLLFLVPPPRPAFLQIGISTLVHLVYMGLLVAGYRRGDLSFVYPIARGLPPVIVTAAAALVVGELPGPISIVGIAAIAGGVLVLGFPAEGSSAGSRVWLLAIGTAACIATYTMVDATGVRASSALPYAVWLITLEGVSFAIVAIAIGGRRLLAEVWSRKASLAGGGLASWGGYAIALWGMGQAKVALVASLRETAVLFAALIGALLLREPFGRRRIAGAILIAMGAVLVKLGG